MCEAGLEQTKVEPAQGIIGAQTGGLFVATSTGGRRRATAKPAKGINADSNRDLHLPSLEITGFRGIENLRIPELGRVTLLAGNNSVGKTTILDAVRLYAAQGHVAAFTSLLESREELLDTIDDDGDPATIMNWPSLFYGRTPRLGDKLAIGAVSEAKGANTLTIEPTIEEDQTGGPRGYRAPVRGAPGQSLLVKYGEDSSTLNPWELRSSRRYAGMRRNALMLASGGQLPGLNCSVLGPGLPDSYEIARYWDEVTLTGDEERIVSALRIIVGPDIERIAVVGEDSEPFVRARRRVMVKLKSQASRMPLRSLGDGAVRIFGAALALANSRDGFLLIDEAENGIHYSHHEDYWRMVIETAVANNTQVLATTHSFDCISGFARVANALPGDQGMLIRLDRGEDGNIGMATYTEDLLSVAEEMGIEVR